MTHSNTSVAVDGRARGQAGSGASLVALARRIADGAGRVTGWVAGALLAAMVLVVLLGVFTRYVLGDALPWTEELSRFLFVYLVFLGAAVTTQRGTHVVADILLHVLPRRLRLACAWVGDMLTIGLAVLLTVEGGRFAQTFSWFMSPAMNVSMQWFYAAIALGGALMVLFALARPLPAGYPVWARATAALVGALAVVLTASLSLGLPAPVPMTLLALAFVVLVLAGVPIAFSMLTASLIFMVSKGRIPLEVIPQNMGGGIDSFPLLAVPFFVVAGALMDTGGISQRLVNFVRSLIGWVRGGLGIVAVLSTYLFSGISGSTTADVSAVGALLLPAMKRAGYKPEQAVSIVAASAALGILVPPCIAMIFLALLSGLSVGALFAAGFLPAAVMAALLIGYIYLKARGWGVETEPRPSLGQVFRAAQSAFVPMLMPIIIFGAIFGGIATATEASAIAVLYGLLVGVFGYREISIRRLPAIFADAAAMTGMVMFLIATASVLSWNLTRENVPAGIAAAMLSLSGSPALFLLASIAVFVLLGAVLEGVAVLVILIPLLLPLVKQLGIDPLHYGIVAVAAIGIGVFLPPIGVCMGIACSIGQVPMGRAAVAFVPYLGILLLGLLVVTFVPWFSLVVPSLIFGR